MEKTNNGSCYMKCKHCGREIKDTAFICPYCGVMQAAEEEDGHIGLLGIPCFLFPPLGLFLFVVWKNKQPERACGAINSSLFGVILVIMVVLFIFEVVV